MADAGTLVTNIEKNLREIRSLTAKIEELAADNLEQYVKLGSNSFTDAYLSEVPAPKPYTAGEFSTAVGNLSTLTGLIDTSVDETFIKITGYTPREG